MTLEPRGTGTLTTGTVVVGGVVVPRVMGGAPRYGHWWYPVTTLRVPLGPVLLTVFLENS